MHGIMHKDATQYQNPLITRYASPEMSEIFSPQRKFSTWRRLWVARAEAEAESGLPISAKRLAQLKEQVGSSATPCKRRCRSGGQAGGGTQRRQTASGARRG